MKRILIAATAAASLFATNLMAAEAVAPLAAGKPAGVKKAQDADTDSLLLYAVGGGALLAGAILAGESSHAATSGTSGTSG